VKELKDSQAIEGSSGHTVSRWRQGLAGWRMEDSACLRIVGYWDTPKYYCMKLSKRDAEH